jgi:hypothetical protein
MAVINNKHPEFKDLLKELWDTQSWQSPMHSLSALDYYRQRPLDEKKKIGDKSFIIVNNSEPVIGFIGAEINDNNSNIIKAYEIPCITIENINLFTINAFKEFKEEFENIIAGFKGSLINIDFMLDGKITKFSKHLLQKGAIPKPVFTQVINLLENEHYLKTKIRKRFRSYINFGIREIKPSVIDNKSLTWQHMLAFKNLHKNVSGRETRSELSWRKQFDMVQSNEGFVVFGYMDKELITAGFFSKTSKNAYYHSSASRRDLFEKPIFHSLMWEAILHSKKIGCHWFDAGTQLYEKHPNEQIPTKKELDISDFKRGFGGETILQLELTLLL